MNDSGNSSWLSNFSHLYVERAALDYSFAQSIITRFPRARIVPIDDYKSIFARPRQHFQIQKRSMKLILAVKKDRFLYPGSGHSQHFNLDNFYYNTLMFNCVYNCDYCYLQGMYPSANVVAFVNTPDYFEATRQAIAERSNIHQPLYVCISYDTDLLAFESKPIDRSCSYGPARIPINMDVMSVAFSSSRFSSLTALSHNIFVEGLLFSRP